MYRIEITTRQLEGRAEFTLHATNAEGDTVHLQHSTDVSRFPVEKPEMIYVDSRGSVTKLTW